MKASELAKALGGTLEGEDVELTACGGLEEARPGDLIATLGARDPALPRLARELLSAD